MKKNVIILVCLLPIFVNSAFSHAQHVHQYFVREGYALLKNQIGDIPLLTTHISTAAGGGGGNWVSKMITAGAWNEDENDIVYYYSRQTPPTIATASPIATILDLITYPLPDGFVSSTHFWDADNGDVLASDLEGGKWGMYFKFTVPNAYTKIKAYEGGRAYFLAWNGGNTSGQFEYRGVDGNLHYYNWFGAILIEYASLYDLQKTGRAWIVGTYQTNGERVTNNIEIRLSTGWRDVFVWEVLGRMCHLLGDMSVPAHAHRDIHGNTDEAMREDSYETWVGSDAYGSPYMAWNGQNSGGMIDPYVSSQPLHYLMYTMQQQADHFGSNGPYEGDGNDFISGNPLPEETAFFTSNPTNSFGGSTGMTGPFDTQNLLIRRDRLCPYAIRATAGLLYWFATESGLLNKITIVNDFNAGQVIVNNTAYSSGYIKGIPNGGTMNLSTLTTQIVNGCTHNFVCWEKLNESGTVIETHQDANWNVSVSNGTYTFRAIYSTPLTASISGPTTASSGQSNIYNVNATGGFPPYNYQWWIQISGVEEFAALNASSSTLKDEIITPNQREPGPTWYTIGTNSPTLLCCQYQSYALECDVTDCHGTTVTSNILDVTIGGSNPPSAPSAPTNVTLQSSSGTYGPIKVSWTNEAGLPDNYEVNRLVMSFPGVWEVVATTTNTYWIDQEYTYAPGGGDFNASYKIRAIKGGLYSDYSPTASVRAEGGYKMDSQSANQDAQLAVEIPERFALNQNFPNPFNPSTTISFDLPKDSPVSLKIYDMIGHEIATLVDGYRSAGRYNFSFDASRLSSGMYIYKIQAGEFTAIKKMQVLK